LASAVWLLRMVHSSLLRSSRKVERETPAVRQETWVAESPNQTRTDLMQAAAPVHWRALRIGMALTTLAPTAVLQTRGWWAQNQMPRRLQEKLNEKGVALVGGGGLSLSKSKIRWMRTDVQDPVLSARM